MTTLIERDSKSQLNYETSSINTERATVKEVQKLVECVLLLFCWLEQHIINLYTTDQHNDRWSQVAVYLLLDYCKRTSLYLLKLSRSPTIARTRHVYSMKKLSKFRNWFEFEKNCKNSTGVSVKLFNVCEMKHAGLQRSSVLPLHESISLSLALLFSTQPASSTTLGRADDSLFDFR